MVALLRPQPEISVVPRPLRLVADRGHLVGERDAAPGVETRRPREEAAAGISIDVGQLLMMVVAAVVIFGGLALLRASQGGPAADNWAEVGAAGTVGATANSSAIIAAPGGQVIAAPGDQIVVAAPGDSFWSIARTIAPDADPRPVVAALIEANGGDSLQIGQQIVIPEQLLD